MSEELSFENALSELKLIVEKLQKESLSLEESLKLFEEGSKLSRLCTKQLDEAELKVYKLIQNEAGELEEVPFQED